MHKIEINLEIQVFLNYLKYNIKEHLSITLKTEVLEEHSNT